ncbi:MAG: HIT domain-containing protein [Nitrospinota bacterium]|nr:HIT domain-containing protein [Nitrospinota bacterium]
MTQKPIWAPWRLDYILGPKEEGCVFCSMPEDNEDEKHHILYRGKTCYVVLNLFPYNNGHLMVCPFRHLSDYTALTSEELSESAQLQQKSILALKQAFRPDGFNVGLNLGSAAGAGIEEHLHLHIVPRWNGDFNFMPVIGQTKVMPQHLKSTYEALADKFR